MQSVYDKCANKCNFPLYLGNPKITIKEIVEDFNGCMKICIKTNINECIDKCNFPADKYLFLGDPKITTEKTVEDFSECMKKCIKIGADGSKVNWEE